MCVYCITKKIGFEENRKLLALLAEIKNLITEFICPLILDDLMMLTVHQIREILEA